VSAGVLVRSAVRTAIDVFLGVVVLSFTIGWLVPLRPDAPGVGLPYPFPIAPDTLWYRLCDAVVLIGIVMLFAAHVRARARHRVGLPYAPVRHLARAASVVGVVLLAGCLLAANLSPVGTAPGYGSGATTTEVTERSASGSWVAQTAVIQDLFVRNRSWFWPVTVLGVDQPSIARQLPGWRVRLIGERMVAPGRYPFHPRRIAAFSTATVTLAASRPGCGLTRLAAQVVLRSVPLRIRSRGSTGTSRVALQPPLRLACPSG
jgi:hypothetical protein